MTEIQLSMIAEARRRYDLILPCASKASLEECFTDEGEYGLWLWFNTADGNTHVVREVA